MICIDAIFAAKFGVFVDEDRCKVLCQDHK